MMGIEGDEEAIVDDGFTTHIEAVQGVSVQEDRDGLRVASAPILVVHRLSVGSVPPNVRDARAMNRPPEEVVSASEHGMTLPQRDQTGGKRQKLAVRMLPIYP